MPSVALALFGNKRSGKVVVKRSAKLVNNGGRGAI